MMGHFCKMKIGVMMDHPSDPQNEMLYNSSNWCNLNGRGIFYQGVYYTT